MDQLEATLTSLIAPISRMLNPVMAQLDRLEFQVSQVLLRIGLPSYWAATLLTAGWIILVLMALRVMPTWLRAIFLLIVGLLFLKARGYLP